MDERDAQPAPGRSEWNVDPTTDYPVGPDDAGNAVMHGIGFLVTGCGVCSTKFELILKAILTKANRTREARGGLNPNHTLRLSGEANVARLAISPVANKNQKFPYQSIFGWGCAGAA